MSNETAREEHIRLFPLREVVKRDGATAPFEADKIRSAIRRAGEATGEFDGDEAGLHTAGAYPEALSKLLPHLDWVGMDIKASFPDYERITGVPGSGQAAERSATLVRECGVMHRFRTTVDPCLFSAEQVDSLRRIVVEGWRSRCDIQPVERFGNCNEVTSQTDSRRRPVSQRSAATFQR